MKNLLTTALLLLTFGFSAAVFAAPSDEADKNDSLKDNLAAQSQQEVDELRAEFIKEMKKESKAVIKRNIRKTKVS